MKEFDAEIEYLLSKSSRRGIAPQSEIAEVGVEYGESAAEAVADRLHSMGVQLVEDQYLGFTSQSNVLLNDLTLAELVSLCLRLPVVPKAPRRLQEHVLGERGYERDLRRLDYLDTDSEWYYFAPSFSHLQRDIRSLFCSGQIPFAKDWELGDKRTDLNYIKMLIRHPVFCQQILPTVTKHYLSLKGVGLLLRWIKSTKKPAPSMHDVVNAGLECDKVETVLGLLFSNRPSSSEDALTQRRDVCFACPHSRPCEPLRNALDPFGVLQEYRSKTFERLVESRYPGMDLRDCLLHDGLISKFYVPYSITVSSKSWMLQTQILHSGSMILDKGHGKYCPLDDTWALLLPGKAGEYSVWPR